MDSLPSQLKVSIPGQPEAPLSGQASGVVPQVTLGILPYWGNNPTEGTRNNHFAVQFQGYLEILQAGEYTFYFTTGSTGRLMINGVAVITLDNGGGQNSGNGTIQLEEGRHEIELAASYGGFPPGRLFERSEFAPDPGRRE